MSKPIRNVAIIGGGLSGLTCAYALKASGFNVDVFDMGTHGPGGRAASRRQAGFQFDHGCSFIAAPRSEKAQRLVQELRSEGVLSEWRATVNVYDAAAGELYSREDWAQQGQASGSNSAEQSSGFCNLLRTTRGGHRLSPLLVGYPSSDAVAKHLAAESGAQTHWGTRVTSAAWKQSTHVWSIAGHAAASRSQRKGEQDSHLGDFDALVFADSGAFREGAAGNIAIDGSELDDVAAQVSLSHDPTFALMVSFPHSLGLPFDACALHGHPSLMWLSCDSSKPGREREDEGECWVALASFPFAKDLLAERPLTRTGEYQPQTRSHLEGIVPLLQDELVSTLKELGIHDVPEPTFSAVQRWGAGFVANPLGVDCVADEKVRVVACGDYCLGSTAENAMNSGLAAAETLASWK